jgi:endonuclease-3 related protein
MSDVEHELRRYYETLYAAWGPQHWWPAQSRFEVMVGAILTQNTSWKNVELALTKLRSARALSMQAMRDVPLEDLEQLIRSAGFFRQKASRLKTFISFVDSRYSGSLDRMFAQPTNELRAELLALNGIGHETADSILLYAGNHPVFVVDAYTRRIVERHGLFAPSTKYDEIRKAFEQALSRERAPSALRLHEDRPTIHSPSRMSNAKRSALAQRFNDMHGLIVQVGKHACRSKIARCDRCPLRLFLPQSHASSDI